MSKAKRRNPGPPVRRLTQDEYISRIERNGITRSDLKKSFEEGYQAGAGWAYDAAYGSVIMALRREFGFDRDRISRVAMAAAAVQIEYMTNDEMYDQLKKECGVDLPRMRDVTAGGGV